MPNDNASLAAATWKLHTLRRCSAPACPFAFGELMTPPFFPFVPNSDRISTGDRIVRDDRGRGSACAKAVAAATSRCVGTSVTARTPNACVWSAAGRRRGGRPGGARTTRPKPSMPRRNVRAVSAPPPRRNHRRSPKLRRRVVTQQKFFRRLLCATGPGALNHL